MPRPVHTRSLVEELKKHKAARYRATEYLTEEAKRKPEYRDLFRAQDRIARLMSVLLLKRLESSIAAFRSTLKALIQSNRNFRDALDDGFVPIGRTDNTSAFPASHSTSMICWKSLQQEEQRRQEQGGQRVEAGSLHQ